MGYILKDELDQFWENAKKEMKQLYEKIKQHPLTCLTCIIVIIIALLSLIVLPYWRVTQFGITNPKDFADAENSYRATIAQILGGIAVAIGIYFAWGNLTTAREGQITERFTRAVDQLGNPSIEIRLGGIYALERIANEYEEYYSQIIEILTAYVRLNSCIREEEYKTLDFQELSNRAYLDSDTRLKDSPEIQAIVNVICRRKNFLGAGEFNGLEFQKTYLRAANFTGTTTDRMYTFIHNNRKVQLYRDIHLEGAFFYKADLIGADFENSYLECANFDQAYLTRAYFMGATIKKAKFDNAHLERVSFENSDLHKTSFDWSKLLGAIFVGANLKGTNFHLAELNYAMFDNADLEDSSFQGANLENAFFGGANLKRVDFHTADLTNADFKGADLKGATLSVFQLSKVKTLYNAKLDEELEKPLKEMYPDLFKEPKAKF